MVATSVYMCARSRFGGLSRSSAPRTPNKHAHGIGIELRPFTGTTTSESPSAEHALLSTVFKSIKVRTEQENEWEDEAIYGGLLAIRDIRRLESLHPDVGFLRALSDAMEKTKPSDVMQAAYDVVMAAQDGWLRLPNLRSTLEGFDFPDDCTTLESKPVALTTGYLS